MKREGEQEEEEETVKAKRSDVERHRKRVDNQQVLSSFHPCGRALLSIVMGCLPSWADELMSGFNANLLNWHTAPQGEQRHSTTAVPEEGQSTAERVEEKRRKR